MIPKIVHQTWKTSEVPDHWKESHDKWQALGYEYRLWTDDMNRELIANEFAWFLPTYDAYPHGIQRADAIRYFILFKYGGIYSDLDLVPTAFFQQLFEGTFQQLGGVVLTESSSFTTRRERFTNALMMSEKEAPFWPVVWRMLQTDVSKRKGAFQGFLAKHFHYFRVMFSTGPGVLNDAFKEYSAQQPVHVLPSSYVHHHTVDWSARGVTPAITSLKGSSWHKKGDSDWLNLTAVWKARDYYLIPLSVCAIVLAIVLIVLAAKGRIV